MFLVSIRKIEMNQILRTFIRHIGILILTVFLQAPALCRADTAPSETRFQFDRVIEMAETLSGKSFESPKDLIPKFLLDLNYDQWRDIRFQTDQSLWRADNLPFEVQFFHAGAFYDLPVDIFIVDDQTETKVAFSPEMFDYGQNDFKDKLPGNLGYAGFRIHYNINNPDYKDEVVVFLGASYFRAVGKNQGYGLSARGLAIDTGLDSGEEFPFFKRFWLVKPEPDATELTVFALLDSKSYTGAYSFTIRPGEKTVMPVECRLFQRKPVKKLGIAPLTSMFLYGENTNTKPIDDFRPEVHDSDGLLIATATGEWIWHPLQNPNTLSTSTFHAPNPAGFGLLQRDLDFDHYQDLEARYDNRPSVWITPREGDWGKGHVELVQIPSDREINDNIVTFWVPEIPPEKKKLSFSYLMEWYLPRQSPHGGGYVTSTYMSYNKNRNTITFLIDFAGGRLADLGPDAYPDKVVTVGNNVSIIEQRVEKNPFIDGWRLVFKIRGSDQNTLEKILANGSQPITLRAFLRLDKDVLTETWNYTFFQ